MNDLSIPRAEFEVRQAHAQRLAREAGVDALLVVGGPFYDRPGALAYLTGHYPPFPATEFMGARRGVGNGVFVLPTHGDGTLIVGHPNYRSDIVVAANVRVDADVPGAAVAALDAHGLRAARVGLVGADLAPLALFQAVADGAPGVEWRPADELLNSLRRVKSEAEQAALRRAASVADAGLRAAQAAVRFEARERDIAAAGTAGALAAGADSVRYLRVHSGPWSAWGSRWPPATERALQKSDLVTLDIIGAAGGYAFDVLRTTVVGYDLLPEQRRMMNAILKTLARVTEAIRPGMVVGELVTQGLRRLEEAGYGAHASRFMGHGIGLETVEAPALTPDDQTRLEVGMVLCVEPAVYIPGWGGGSLEDEVIVRDGEPEVITTTALRLWE